VETSDCGTAHQTHAVGENQQRHVVSRNRACAKAWAALGPQGISASWIPLSPNTDRLGAVTDVAAMRSKQQRRAGDQTLPV
jgi:hypothetical protein